MFGLNPKPKIPVYRPRPVPKIVSVPGNQPGCWGHIAREPNTSYDVKLMQYYQKVKPIAEEALANIAKEKAQEKISQKYIKHFDLKTFNRVLSDKVNEKVKDLDANLEERREKLKNLLWREEREYLREIVEEAQNGKLRRRQEKLEMINELKRRKEAEKEALAKEMRLRQNLARCDQLRPHVVNQRNRETRQGQLVQMKENKAKKMSEKELDYYWRELNKKCSEAKEEREVQERLKVKKQQNEFKFYADLQATEKMVKEEKRKQEMLAEREHSEKLKREFEEDKKREREEYEKKRRDTINLFTSQLKEKNECVKRQAHKEETIQKAYHKLATEEIERQKAAAKAKVTTAYEDMLKFKKYLSDTKQEREIEERKMEKIVDSTMKKIHKQYDDEQCQKDMARRALNESVQKGRIEQIEYRKKQEEENQKQIKEELKLTNSSLLQNDLLRSEYKLKISEKTKKYREALEQQITYKKVLEEREREKNKKIEELGKLENEKYERLVAEVMSGNIKISETHLFRQVIDNGNCPCPKPNY